MIVQLDICGEKDLTIPPTHQPMLHAENFKQLTQIREILPKDLQEVEQKLRETEVKDEQWEEQIITSRRDLQDFMSQKRDNSDDLGSTSLNNVDMSKIQRKRSQVMGLEEAVNNYERNAMDYFNIGYDYDQRRPVNIVRSRKNEKIVLKARSINLIKLRLKFQDQFMKEGQKVIIYDHVLKAQGIILNITYLNQ